MLAPAKVVWTLSPPPARDLPPANAAETKSSLPVLERTCALLI